MIKLTFSVILLLQIALGLGEYAGYTYQQPELIATYAGAPALGVYQPAQQQQTYAPELSETFHKEFYSFEAPEEHFEDPYASQKIAAAIQRNLRVIFIKAPENRGLENAAVTLAKHATDDRTAIYVLNRQTDISDLASRLSTVRESNSYKPQVHFVKYRTPEEAVHAQQAIQAQYDAVRGTTYNSHGNTASVLDFATKQAIQSVAALPLTTDSVKAVGVGGLESSQLSGFVGSYAQEPSAASYEPSANSGLSTTSQHQNLATALHYNVNSVSTSAGVLNNLNVGPAASVAYAVNTNSVEDGGAGVVPPVYGYARRSSFDSDNIVSKLNERIHTGSRFVFPTEATTSPVANSYLPPIKRRT